MMSEALQEEIDRLSSPPDPGNELTGEAFSQPLEVLLSKPAVSVDVSDTVRRAIEVMTDNGFGAVLVTRAGKLAGIFTERDVLAYLRHAEHTFLDQKMEAVMTRDPVSLQRGDAIVYVANNMHVGGYRHVPIVDSEGRPESIVSIKDVMRFVLSHFPEEVINTVSEPYRGPARVESG
jgi:CBS domain-containing protein